jgi:hypothetical protein
VKDEKKEMRNVYNILEGKIKIRKEQKNSYMGE